MDSSGAPPKKVYEGPSPDKPWQACDNQTSSKFYGNCYLVFDEEDENSLIYISRSTDGGQTWDPVRTTEDQATGIGGVPAIQPNGQVIVPTSTSDFSALFAFHSTDGGGTWSATLPITSVQSESLGGAAYGSGRADLRTAPMPSVVSDASGKIYVSWFDCRFHPNCTANDVVLTSSQDGVSWSEVKAIPIGLSDPNASLLFPGLGVDSRTSGDTAKLGIVFYSVEGEGCREVGSKCQVYANFTATRDGGKTWNPPLRLGGPMNPDWISTTARGKMIGDYTQTAYVNGVAFPIYSNALQPTSQAYAQGIYTVPVSDE